MAQADLEKVLARLPSTNDQAEVRIVRLIEEKLLTTDWAKTLFRTMRQWQIDFLVNAMADPDKAYDFNQALMQQLALESNTQIVEGAENLPGLTGPVMIVTNHLGDYKVAAIKPSEINLELPIDQIHPWPMYYAPYSPIARVLESDIFGTHVVLPEPLSLIQEACGMIMVIADKEDGLESLRKQGESLLAAHPSALWVIFPEGGTSGKRNNGGPYDLLEFRSGAWVLAAKLGVSVLPVAKYFNPNGGYELRVFPPVKLEENQSKEYYRGLATRAQTCMQEWLNIKCTSNL